MEYGTGEGGGDEVDKAKITIQTIEQLKLMFRVCMNNLTDIFSIHEKHIELSIKLGFLVLFRSRPVSLVTNGVRANFRDLLLKLTETGPNCYG